MTRSTQTAPAPTHRAIPWIGVALAAAVGIVAVTLPSSQVLAVVAVVAVVLAVAVGLRWVLPDTPNWIRLLVAVVVGQLILNYGFGNLMLRLGALPLPLTEVVLFTGLAAVAVQRLTRHGSGSLDIPAIVWILCGWVVLHLTLHLPSGWARAGIPAVRDALPALELLFLIPSYVAARWLLQRDAGWRARRRLFYVVLVAMGLYGLTYPAQEWILQVSPTTPGFSQQVPIFGAYGSSSLCVMLVAVLLWTWQHSGRPTAPKVAFVVLCIVSSLLTYALTQARISYVYLVLALLVLGCTGRLWRQLGGLTAIVLLGLSALFFIELLGIEVQGRITSITVSGIVDHVLSLTGESRSAEFAGSAEGVTQRREWRAAALQKWGASPLTMTLGIGVGDALTNHVVIGTGGEQIVVREPHNSFVTMLTRGGLVGLALFVGLMVSVLVITTWGWLRHRATDRRVAAIFLAGLLWHLMALMQAWGQPYFENPYTAVPCYFVYGGLFALWQHQGGWKAAFRRLPSAGTATPAR